MLVGAIPVAIVFAVLRVTQTLSERDAIGLCLAVALAALGFLNARIAVILTVLSVLFSALLRRLAPAIDPSSDLLAIAPFIVMLPLAVLTLRKRNLSLGVGVALGIFALAAVRSPGSGVPAIVNLAVPVVAAMGVRASPQLQGTFAKSWIVGSSIAWVYGFIQFFATPTWDKTWLINANFDSAGVPGTPDFRPFATLPSPGTAAFLAVLTLLMAVFARPGWRVPPFLRVSAISLTLPFIAISGVRSAWLFGGAALIIGLATGLNRKATVPIAATVAAVGAAVSQVPAFASTFSLRAQTFSSLNTDASFQSRTSLLSSARDYISLTGSGLGTATDASRIGGAGLDNGYIVVLAETGLIGVLALVLLIYGLSRGVAVAATAFLAFWLLCNLAGYNFGNYVGFVVVACLTLRQTPQLRDLDLKER